MKIRAILILACAIQLGAAHWGVAHADDFVGSEDAFEVLSPDEIGDVSDEISPALEVPTLDRNELIITVSKAAQRMNVTLNGQSLGQFKVSTGKEKWVVAKKSGRRYFAGTPVGRFSVLKTVRAYWSNTWRVYMNYSVFITQGVALHATTSDHIAELGRPTSGGCVRLAPENAQKVYGWVAKYGAKNTTIIVK